MLKKLVLALVLLKFHLPITSCSIRNLNVVDDSTTRIPVFGNESSTTTKTIGNKSGGNVKNSSESSCECGILGAFPTGKIVGGTPVHLGRNRFWPWFATLVHVSRPNISHCGASLISPRYVLTAGHCIIPILQAGLRNFRVKLGYNDLSLNEIENLPNSSEAKAMDFAIESVSVHPKFEQSYPYHFDIGIIKLSRSVKCSSNIRPVCLPQATNDLNFSKFCLDSPLAITAGFGKTGINQSYSQTLLQIEINIISNDECRHHYSKLSYKGPPILKNMMCAWAKGKDSCVGDSGGPVFKSRPVMTENDKKGVYEQIGITSWGIGCANEKFPGVYTKLSKFLPYIKSNVKDFRENIRKSQIN